MFTEIAVVNAVTLSHLKEDKNGLLPVMLQTVAGNGINKCTLSGTVAERAGFTEGHSYLVAINEIESNEYGRQFQFNKLMEMSALDIIQASKELGAAKVTDVTKVIISQDVPRL
jgi:hypothetical protein